MRERSSAHYLYLFIIVVVSLLNFQSTAAHPKSSNDFWDALAQQIADTKIHTLAVAEFVTPEGATSPRGKYLAGLLCENWLQHHRELVVVKPASFGEALAAQKLSLQELKTPESLKQIGKALGVEAIVSGSLTDTTDGYLLTVSVNAVSGGVAVLTIKQPVAHSLVLDSLATTDGDTTATAPRAGAHGVGTPSCNYTPSPVFTAEARKAKVSAASAVLLAVITPEGRTTSIRVTKDPGYGFALRAVEALAKWHCKPALDSDKKPIAVTVPIEITFRDSEY